MAALQKGKRMSDAHADTHQHGSRQLFLYVWFWLLALTGVEVYLAYIHLGVKLMLTLLMGLSIIKASLIISYFMHLRYEKRSLVLILMPAMVFVIVLLFAFFPDSLRLVRMRP
jgi:cytochrome c oxidase subunit 4